MLTPRILMSCIVLSNQVSLYKAEIHPKKIPKNVAIQMAEIAKINVLGKVSAMISFTFFPFF